MATTESNGSTNGVGEPRDLLATMAEAAVKWSATPTPDPNVWQALSLGWRIGQALSWTAGHKPPECDEFASDEAAWSVLVGQIEDARDRLAKSGVQADDRDAADASPEGRGVRLPEKVPPATKDKAVMALYGDVLKDMWIADTSLGRGVTLGYELQQLCHENEDKILGRFTKQTPAIKLLLLALASKLPPNAAHTVRNSLLLWSRQIADALPSETQSQTQTSSDTQTLEPQPLESPPAGSRQPTEHIAICLRQQGAVWRTMLTGQCAAKDVLRLSDYVGTAEEVVGRLRELAYSAARTSLRWVAAIVVLALAGVLVLIFFNTASGVAAGLTSLVAAIGLTWKGIGTFIGQAAAKGEKALWDAQVDWTIAYRCTVSVSPEPKDQAANRKQRIERHAQKWRDWQERWPDLNSDRDANG